MASSRGFLNIQSLNELTYEKVSSASDLSSRRGELTVKGSWAGVKVTPASEVSERARLAPVASRRVRWESAPPVG